MMAGTWLGLVGGAAALLAMSLWGVRLVAVAVSPDKRPFIATFAVSVLLGVAALALGTSLAGAIAAWVAIGLGGTYLALQLQAKQDSREPALKVGDPILDFVAPDEHGEPFDLASTRGTPVLLKFFRGHW